MQYEKNDRTIGFISQPINTYVEKFSLKIKSVIQIKSSKNLG